MNYNTMRQRYLNPDRFEEKHAYLYSIHRGKLERYEGVVSFDKQSILGVTFYVRPERKVSSYSVSTREGVISNRLIWFYDINDEEAKRLFIEYERQEIEELMQKIEKHKENIAMLERSKA